MAIFHCYVSSPEGKSRHGKASISLLAIKKNPVWGLSHSPEIWQKLGYFLGPSGVEEFLLVLPRLDTIFRTVLHGDGSKASITHIFWEINIEHGPVEIVDLPS